MRIPRASILKDCTTLLLVFFVFAQMMKAATTHDSDQTLPGYVVLVGSGKAKPMSQVLADDSLFYTISQGVVFPVNKSELNPDDPFLIEFEQVIMPEVRRRGWELAGVGFRGAASPEGLYQRNVELANQRTQVIIDFLRDRSGIPASTRISTSKVVEDYYYLVLLMRNAGDPKTEFVASLVRRYMSQPLELKSRLQRAEGGRLWRRLLEEYFPSLRTARLVLFFRPKEIVGVIQPVEVRPIEPWTMQRLAMESLEIECREPEPEAPRRHMLSVGTNLLYDAFYMPNYGMAPMPNVELEFYPRRGNWTLLAAFTCPFWQNYSSHKFFQIRDYHFEARRYFKPGVWHTGWFVAAYANTNKYGIGLSRTKGWQGEGVGGALKVGHSWQLGRKGGWRLEVSAALGGYVTRFDPYVYGNPVTGSEDGDYYYDYTGAVSDFNRRNHRRTWFGPTEIGLTLRRDLLFWRKEAAR